MRQLVVNADDFGFTRGVNEGIIEAHRAGILTATTLMANGTAFDHAIDLARGNPRLDVGCHLVLVQGVSLLDGRPLPPNPRALLKALATRRIAVYEELRVQIEKVREAGIAPTHLDTHKHTHLLPPVLSAVARLGREYGIRWVRRPFDFPLEARGIPFPKRLISKGMGILRPWFHIALARHHCLTTDHFAGFQMTGQFQTREMIDLIRQLPDGITEFMCHPGYCTPELRAAPTRLTDSRERELAALVDPRTRGELEARGVKLANYRELGARNE